MTRYLFLASSGRLDDGGAVLNRQLSEALARGNDVHLVTIGRCEQQREGVTVVELDEALLSPQTIADIKQTRHFVDRFSKIIRAALDEQGPERVGLPTDPGAFDMIVGYGDVTGPAALHLKDAYYPDAKVSTVITLDPKGFFRTLDLPELEKHRIENHRRVLAGSDLILAHGPKSAVDARQLAAEWSQARSLPPSHEFLPGVEISRGTPARWQPGEPFNVLMLGRMHDVNKGAADVTLAVAHMRTQGFEDMHLTLRGIDPKMKDAFVDLLDRQLGEGRWNSFVTVEEFTSDEAAKERSIRESHVMVMATESEAYGLAASEYAAQGKPLIVAEGYGNGFATLLRDENRIPRDIADRFVLDDSGSRSANGSLMGEGAADTGVPRHHLIAARLKHVYNDYDGYAEVALRLRGHLSEYTLDHTAASIGQAVDDVLVGNIRHTKQLARGVNAVPSEEELLRGIPEDKRDLILDPRVTPRWSPAVDGTSVPGADPALARRVILNDLSAQRGHREASPFEMVRSGMSGEETSAAISAWEALGRPETVREREARLRDGQSAPEPAERATRVAEASATTPEPAAEPTPEPTASASRTAEDPEPARESGTPTATPDKTPERHQGIEAQTPKRTSSRIWETPKPPIASMAEHRTQWALYDDLHGYGRRTPLISVRTPTKAPGAYRELLHPDTGAAYERDQRQVESGSRGYGG
ncbi:glycosyltransferase [Nocardiopsis sp. N85]|uniref:glycosyltransferase n=1 Tax=Nocardiopsis sp. N85 TaxID=3029400 RepID=UPI00237FCA8E|nr:glycosyltransferase [Nocardiopsis sp. N85]MDE3719950.1 glycosyltransferase [Nocardiopsis sp. N85]